MELQWDYTSLAATYDERADYDSKLIREVVRLHETDVKDLILDLGAGTGKLTKELIKCGLKVLASEPNNAMRSIGIQNIASERCTWISSAAEEVDVGNNSISSTWFGSSFNVINHKDAFSEFSRYSKPFSWLTCLWNHRDLNDPIQRRVEEIFRDEIPNYNYGTRRQDPSETILSSGLFKKIEHFSSTFEIEMNKTSFIEAWKSHGTLLRQSRDANHFSRIIQRIDYQLAGVDKLVIPYTTRLWTARSVIDQQ